MPVTQKQDKTSRVKPRHKTHLGKTGQIKDSFENLHFSANANISHVKMRAPESRMPIFQAFHLFDDKHETKTNVQAFQCYDCIIRVRVRESEPPE